MRTPTKSKLWWAFRVEKMGPPPILPGWLLSEMEDGILTPREWYYYVGGTGGPHTLAEIDYAVRWVRLKPGDP